MLVIASIAKSLGLLKHGGSVRAKCGTSRSCRAKTDPSRAGIGHFDTNSKYVKRRKEAEAERGGFISIWRNPPEVHW